MTILQKFASRAPAASFALAGHLRFAVVVLVLACLAGLAGCSGDQENGDLRGLSERDRVAVEVATTEQVNMGRQIESASQLDNAYEVCFEMCKRSKDSCLLSNKVCNISTKYPKATELAARCDVSRERCRIHRTMIPRICTCYE